MSELTTAVLAIAVEVKSPFDPSPRALDPATNGFVWCEVCQAPQPAAGHDCVHEAYDPERDALIEALWELTRRAMDPTLYDFGGAQLMLKAAALEAEELLKKVGRL